VGRVLGILAGANAHGDTFVDHRQKRNNTKGKVKKSEEVPPKS
jgi:hypothetical protein